MGLAALEVQTMSRVPSAFFTSQDQPEPKKETVLLEKSSMKASTEPHLASMAVFKGPSSSLLPLGHKHYTLKLVEEKYIPIERVIPNLSSIVENTTFGSLDQFFQRNTTFGN